MGIISQIHILGRRGKSRGQDERGESVRGLTFIHIIVGHDGHALLPHHADVCPVAVARPQEHGEQNGLGNRAPQHTQYHPVVGSVVLQAGKTHHLDRVKGGIRKMWTSPLKKCTSPIQ